jgi:hypothetical protein
VETKKVTIWIEEEEWERLRSLPDPSNKINASYHVREAIRMYLKVLDVEDSSKHSAKIFEDQDRELD